MIGEEIVADNIQSRFLSEHVMISIKSMFHCRKICRTFVIILFPLFTGTLKNKIDISSFTAAEDSLLNGGKDDEM